MAKEVSVGFMSDPDKPPSVTVLCHLQAVLVQPVCSGASSFDPAAAAAPLQHKLLIPCGPSLIKETLALNIMVNIILDVKDEENFLNPIRVR